MVMWKLKNCPRCKGDMFIYEDMDCWYEQCLQCSCRHELMELAKFKEQLVLAGEKRVKSDV